jgi:hypothetical protein
VMAVAAEAAGADDSPATRAIGAQPLTPTSKHRRFSAAAGVRYVTTRPGR